MTAPMKLSDAILKGCEIIPEQAFGAYYRDDRGEPCYRPQAKSACALGTARIGAQDEMAGNINMDHLVCPECGDKYISPVVHLNDDHRWSRERIAEWLKEQGL